APKAAYNGSIPPQVEMLYRTALPKFSRLVAGRRPVSSSLREHTAKFQVAVTAATARKWHLRLGSVMTVRSATVAIRMVVTGIIRPVGATTSFWTEDPNAAAATFNATPITGGYWLGAVFVGPTALANLEYAYAYDDVRLDWEYPLALGSLNA